MNYNGLANIARENYYSLFQFFTFVTYLPIGKRGMIINYKGSQGQTERAVGRRRSISTK
jgi:hypothetical protein